MKFGDDLVELPVVNSCTVCWCKLLVQNEPSPGILHSFTCFVGCKKRSGDIQQKLELRKTVYDVSPWFRTRDQSHLLFHEIVAPKKHCFYNSSFVDRPQLRVCTPLFLPKSCSIEPVGTCTHMFALSPTPMFIVNVNFLLENGVQLFQSNRRIFAYNVTAYQSSYHHTKNSLVKNVEQVLGDTLGVEVGWILGTSSPK